jgi:type VI secretion system protein ImpG
VRDDLLLYYERELSFLRQMALDFAERYPKVAGRLSLEPDKCEDPHVERLLESFALLAARVHLKIDDEFPEMTEAILGIVYPQFIRPIPSMTIAEFELDPEAGKIDQGLPIPAGQILYTKHTIQEVPCKFRTCYDLTLYPVRCTQAEFLTPDRLRPLIKAPDAQYAIPVRFQCPIDVELDKLKMDRLQLFLNGDSSSIHTLYEALCSQCTRLLLRNPKEPRMAPIELPLSSFRPMGFDAREGMLDYPGRSFLAYRQLQEYFAFPEKFFFVEVSGLAQVLSSGFQNEFELVFFISRLDNEESRTRLEKNVTAGTFRTSCTPVINLFEQTCEPIPLDQKKSEYPIIPDNRRANALELHSIQEVVSIDVDQQTTVAYEPFYSIRHAQTTQKQKTFYIANRRPSTKAKDEGTDLFLSLVDLSFRPVHPKMDSITIKGLCTNRDLPSRLPIGAENGDFEMQFSGPLKRITALRKPTPTLRPSLHKEIYWQLISHLSLNYLSLVEQGKEAFQQILRLYNFTKSPANERLIAGIRSLRSERRFARLVSDEGIAFARGFAIDMEFDEEQFVGSGAFLFASVLERFLANYASLNSFTQFTARSVQRKEPIKQWPPRAGQKILV